MDTINTRPKNHPQLILEKDSGWNMFSPEVAWFIHDFFRYDLNGYEKLIFYCYYIKGMTLMEIGDAADCTFQNIGNTVKNIEKRLHKRWRNRDKWRVPSDSNPADKPDSGRDKRRDK